MTYRFKTGFLLAVGSEAQPTFFTTVLFSVTYTTYARYTGRFNGAVDVVCSQTTPSRPLVWRAADSAALRGARNVVSISWTNTDKTWRQSTAVHVDPLNRATDRPADIGCSVWGMRRDVTWAAAAAAAVSDGGHWMTSKLTR